MDPETGYGGGEIYFDDVLVRKDGRFVLPSLQCLNPEELVLDNQFFNKNLNKNVSFILKRNDITVFDKRRDGYEYSGL